MSTSREDAVAFVEGYRRTWERWGRPRRALGLLALCWGCERLPVRISACILSL
jgi:hypothetical protein